MPGPFLSFEEADMLFIRHDDKVEIVRRFIEWLGADTDAHLSYFCLWIIFDSYNFIQTKRNLSTTWTWKWVSSQKYCRLFVVWYNLNFYCSLGESFTTIHADVGVLERGGESS